MLFVEQSMVRNVIPVFFFCLAGLLFGGPISRQTADRAAGGWLKRHPAPMETGISRDAHPAETAADPDGQILYYVVRLKPQGFMVLSADDRIEPVIVFSSTGRYDHTESNPLRVLLEYDMKSRLSSAGQSSADENPANVRTAGEHSDARYKWQALLEEDTTPESGGEIRAAGLTFVSDVRVPPLVQSKWGQGEAAGDFCYNYYTPNHYVTGCVATVMAQLMRYHSWPTSGIGVHSCLISVDGVEQYWNTRGGNGAGGAYDWSQMPYDPEAGLTSTQRQAIGALCYDAGLSVGMGYTSTGSGASTSTADLAPVNTFGYSNSIYGYIYATYVNGGLTTMMYPNLDAGMPVILSLSGPNVSHAILADGYGYTGGTVYHHLNMGWGGLDDAWYQLPPDNPSFTFTVINGCIYNVYTNGTGEIISGRITTMAGAPLDGVVVTAYQGSSAVKQATTNSRGIYALKNLASNTAFRLSAVKSGYVFTDQNISTGTSADWGINSGNKWGINFTSTNALPPTAMDQFIDVNSLSDICIRLEALDDHLPNPPGQMTFTLTSLPEHGTLSEPNAGIINAVPYSMAAYTNTVCYTPCPYYGGTDAFTFTANDGGESPAGGDSNNATVTIHVDNTLTTEFGIEGTTGTNTMINTTYYASRSQALYLASDIGEARYLTDLSIQFTGVPPIQLKQWTIRLQHTNMTYYDDVVADFLTTGWTQVHQADLTVNQTGWVNFHFSTPFYYNGEQNVLVEFSFNNTFVSNTTGWYLFNNVGGSYDIDRVITIVTDKAVHSSPLTWDFWAGGGSYWGGDWLPSIRFTGTYPITPITGDFDGTCDVKLPDLAVLAAAWNTHQGQPFYNPACDISVPKDNKVDMLDLAEFADHWLNIYQP